MRSSSIGLRRRGQVPGEQVTPGEELERELELHERAHVAGHLDLAGGERMPGLGIPQFERGDRAGSGTGEPEPAADVGVDLQREHGLQRSPERRRSRGVALRHPDREGVDQEIHRPRRLRAGRRRPRGLGRLQQRRRVRPTSPRRAP